MTFFEIDERLSNILHAVAAIPFGFAFAILTVAQFFVHAA
jgi:hypothetical protein